MDKVTDPNRLISAEKVAPPFTSPYSKIAAFCVCNVVMGRQTFEQLTAAFKAVEKELSGRVAELAAKSSSGKLSKDERAEYEQIVRLNDLLSLLKLQAEQYWAPRIAS